MCIQIVDVHKLYIYYKTICIFIICSLYSTWSNLSMTHDMLHVFLFAIRHACKQIPKQTNPHNKHKQSIYFEQGAWCMQLMVPCDMGFDECEAWTFFGHANQTTMHTLFTPHLCWINRVSFKMRKRIVVLNIQCNRLNWTKGPGT